MKTCSAKPKRHCSFRAASRSNACRFISIAAFRRRICGRFAMKTATCSSKTEESFCPCPCGCRQSAIRAFSLGFPAQAILSFAAHCFSMPATVFRANDVAVSLLFDRKRQKWLYWVCSFAHGHRLAHGECAGDVRFGISTVRVDLMPFMPENTPDTAFSCQRGRRRPGFRL